MTKHRDRDWKMSEEEKKRIAREMIKGYKKMAALNKKLAEDNFNDTDDEAS